MYSRVFIILIFVGLVSCTKPSHREDPKVALKAYISKSFSLSTVADREVLASFLTGDAKRRLSTWSDEQFIEAFLDRDREFIRLVIKKVNPVEVGAQTNVTYELTFKEKNEKGAETVVSNLKLAHFRKEGESWLIDRVKNLKQTIEFKNEMSLP